MTVESEADQEERLKRARGASRPAEKPSQQEEAFSQRHLLELGRRHQLGSGGRFDYLRLDITHAEPAEVAAAVISISGSRSSQDKRAFGERLSRYGQEPAVGQLLPLGGVRRISKRPAAEPSPTYRVERPGGRGG
jgi:hypothetical protein